MLSAGKRLKYNTRIGKQPNLSKMVPTCDNVICSDEQRMELSKVKTDLDILREGSLGGLLKMIIPW